jgi:hypothetical protein
MTIKTLNLIKLLTILPLTACASIVDGTSQQIALDTNPSGATCTFERNGVFLSKIDNTPSSIYVKKSKYDIMVSCKKEGYEVTKDTLPSGVEGATFVNILAGGVIGWGVDAASGAMNKYPTEKFITLTPLPNNKPLATNNAPLIN